jgi:hypothetical protein
MPEVVLVGADPDRFFVPPSERAKPGLKRGAEIRAVAVSLSSHLHTTLSDSEAW